MSLLFPSLDSRAIALQPVRMREKQNDFVYYEATTFPRDPFKGCEWALRQLAALGYLRDDGSHLVIDVLSDPDTVIQDYPITRAGFEWLRNRWKFRREVPHLESELAEEA